MTRLPPLAVNYAPPQAVPEIAIYLFVCLFLRQCFVPAGAATAVVVLL